MLLPLYYYFYFLLFRIINQPNEYLPAFDEALKELVKIDSDPSKHDIADTPFYIGLRGSFGDNHVNPRTLRAMYLGKLVCIEGIVTRCKFKYIKENKNKWKKNRTWMKYSYM